MGPSHSPRRPQTSFSHFKTTPLTPGWTVKAQTPSCQQTPAAAPLKAATLPKRTPRPELRAVLALV